MRAVDIFEDGYHRDFSRARGIDAVGFMSKATKIFTVYYIVIFFSLGLFCSVSSGKEEIDLELRGQAMSAELQGVSLRLVLEKLEREKGIWFKGDESVLEEEVSIRFKDLPLYEGLRRILSHINHVLVFDGDNGLVGLFILGKKDRGNSVARDAAVATEKGSPSLPIGEAKASKYPFEAFSDPRPSDNPTKSSPEDPFAQSISPSAENPFADPFGAFRGLQRERTGEN